MKNPKADKSTAIAEPFLSPQSDLSRELFLHVEAINEILAKLIASTSPHDDEQEFLKWLAGRGPIFSWEEGEKQSFCLSIFLFGKSEGVFAHEALLLKLAKECLSFPSHPPLVSFRHLCFSLPQMSSQDFFVAEVKICAEHHDHFSTIKQCLPILEKEIVMCAALQEDLSSIHFSGSNTGFSLSIAFKALQKYPSHLGRDLLKDFARFSALTEETFRTSRPPRHLVRIVCSHYLMQKSLARAFNFFSNQIHFRFRFKRIHLSFAEGTKPVLAILIGVSLPDSHEHFAESFLVGAIQRFFPDARVIQDSFYVNHKPQTNLWLLYFEVEKKSGACFSIEDIRLLEKNLSEELKRQIEIPAF
ncbi:MAG: hypothetical protein ACM3JI_03155, partial [Anaerolineae bacterium]